MKTNERKIIGETFPVEVISHRGRPSFRPLVVKNDPLVRGLASVYILRPVPATEAELIRRGEKWQVEILNYRVLRGEDRKYKFDTKGHPMIVLEVKLIGRLRSFYSVGKWVTVAQKGEVETLVSSDPAVREEIPYMSPDKKSVYVVERITVDTPTKTRVVRERAHHEIPISEYQSGRYNVIQEIREAALTLGYPQAAKMLHGYDPSSSYPKDLPERLFNLC